jgi:hypothetical protein
MAMRATAVLFCTGLVVAPPPLAAQQFEGVGTRAAGMGGAFVAVASDASAVYWNPAGLASGSFFSAVLDGTLAEGQVAEGPRAASGRNALVALGIPALGISYYRLRAVHITPDSPPAPSPGFAAGHASRLTTHHLGVTLVQSLTDGIAVGTTLKFVHGSAGASRVAGVSVDRLLDEAERIETAGGNAFDADIGVMAVYGQWRAGLTVRNVAEPEFDLPGADAGLTLERATRAGVAFQATPAVVLAADIDVERAETGLGERRGFSAGTEITLFPRLIARGGVNLNLAGDEPGGRAAAFSIGGSYAAWGSLLVDVQGTFGEESAARGWGLAARFIF